MAQLKQIKLITVSAIEMQTKLEGEKKEKLKVRCIFLVETKWKRSLVDELDTIFHSYGLIGGCPFQLNKYNSTIQIDLHDAFVMQFRNSENQRNLEVT